MHVPLIEGSVRFSINLVNIPAVSNRSLMVCRETSSLHMMTVVTEVYCWLKTQALSQEVVGMLVGFGSRWVDMTFGLDTTLTTHNVQGRIIHQSIQGTWDTLNLVVEPQMGFLGSHPQNHFLNNRRTSLTAIGTSVVHGNRIGHIPVNSGINWILADQILSKRRGGEEEKRRGEERREGGPGSLWKPIESHGISWKAMKSSGRRVWEHRMFQKEQDQWHGTSWNMLEYSSTSPVDSINSWPLGQRWKKLITQEKKFHSFCKVPSPSEADSLLSSVESPLLAG